MQITVFSRGPALYSTRRLVEAGRMRGHSVDVVDHGRCSPSLAGPDSAIQYDGDPLPLPGVAIPRIGANMTARGVAIIRQLDLLGVPHTLNAEALLLARDKMSCLQQLAAAGVRVPQTTLCFSTYDVRRTARRIGHFPLVVKLLESTHGVGVALARNAYQLERIAEGFLQVQGRVLVQEFIGESDGADIRAFVVGGRVVAAMERRATAGEFRANIHRGASASSVRLSAEDEALVLTTARLTGVEIAGVDLISSRRGMLLMEVNASPGLEGIEGATGTDIAGAIIEHAVSKV